MIAVDIQHNNIEAPAVWSNPSFENIVGHKSYKRFQEPKKSVRFADFAKVHDAPLFMTEMECKAVWYTKTEMMEIAKEQRRLTKEARKSHNVEAFCLRGLEDYVSMRAAIAARSRKVAVLNAVLNEQTKQKEKGIFDASKIRRKSNAASLLSWQQAQELGELDEKAVNAYQATKTVLKVDKQQRKIVIESLKEMLTPLDYKTPTSLLQ